VCSSVRFWLAGGTGPENLCSILIILWRRACGAARRFRCHSTRNNHRSFGAPGVGLSHTNRLPVVAGPGGVIAIGKVKSLGCYLANAISMIVKFKVRDAPTTPSTEGVAVTACLPTVRV